MPQLILPNIYRTFSESTKNLPKEFFQEYELKTFFHGFLTMFDCSKNFQSISENFWNILMQVFEKYYFRCTFAFYRVFSRAFESVKLLQLSNRPLCGNIQRPANPYEDRLSTNQICIQPVRPRTNRLAYNKSGYCIYMSIWQKQKLNTKI